MREDLNWLILLVSGIACAVCLWFASHAPWWGALLAAFAFALVNNTPFVILHEAIHGVGSANPTRNTAMGVIASWMFPTSYTMQRAAHIGHHERNRSDVELYDYYLPHESRTLRQVWLYGGNLLGLYWFAVLLSNVLYLVATPVYRSRWMIEDFSHRAGFGPFARDLAALPPSRVWPELAAAFAYQALLWWALDLNWQGWMLAHWFFALHWSALQYCDHAWSARDAANGAWDLRVSTPARWLALNFHYHLAHHRNPQVPWPLLPAYASHEGQPSFWRVYWSLWRNGVQPAPPLGAPANRSLLFAPPHARDH